MQPPRDPALKLIALFKVAKGVALLLLALGLSRLLHEDLTKTVEGWLNQLRVDPENKYASALLSKVGLIGNGQVALYSYLTFAYAALFLTEGGGLLLRKRWAEWLTVISTGSFVPIEVYELWKHFSLAKVVLLTVNGLIVLYLIWRLRHPSRSMPQT